MKKNLVLFLLIISLTSCFFSNEEKLKKEIMETDKSFSEYSEKNGANAAFLKYAAEDVVLLKPDSYPIVGHASLAENYKSRSDSSYTLTWEPKFASVSKSGDFGYTFGYWKLQQKGSSKELLQGTYVTIWKKQEPGEWKFVLDTGNQGLGNDQGNDPFWVKIPE